MLMNDISLEIWRTLMEKGTAYLGQTDYIRAEDYFRRALKIANHLDVPVVKAFSLRLLSLVQIKQGKVEVAEKGFREALRICEQVQNYKGMAEALAGLASVAVEKNNFEDAVNYYQRAIEVYPVESPQLRLAMLYSDLGQVYSALEQWQEAQKTYLIAKYLCQRHNYPKGEGELSVLIGEAYYRQGDKSQALSFIKYACKIFASIKEEISLINSLQYYAFMKFEVKEMEEAFIALQRAIVLQMKNNFWQEVSESAYFMAKISQGLGNLEEAQAYLELSIKNCPDQEVSLGLRLQSMGKLMVSKEEYGRATKYFLEAAEIFELLGDDLRLGECYEYLAFLMDSLGEEEQSEYYRKEAKRMIAVYHAHSLNAVQRLAEYYENRRQYLDALQCYWQALEIARDIGYSIEELERAVQRVSRKVRQRKH